MWQAVAFLSGAWRISLLRFVFGVCGGVLLCVRLCCLCVVAVVCCCVWLWVCCGVVHSVASVCLVVSSCCGGVWWCVVMSLVFGVVLVRLAWCRVVFVLRRTCCVVRVQVLLLGVGALCAVVWLLVGCARMVGVVVFGLV